MSFFIVAATVASTAVATYGQVQAGKAADEAAKIAAREAELEAQTEALGRMQELNRTLAANQASMAASGVSGGTPESIALESAKQIGASEQVIGLTSKLKQAAMIRQGQAAKASAYTSALSTAIKGGTAALKALPDKKKKDT